MPGFDELAALYGADPTLFGGNAALDTGNAQVPSDTQAQDLAGAYARALASDAPVAPPLGAAPVGNGQPDTSVLQPAGNPAPGTSQSQSGSYSVGGSALNQKTLADLQTGTRAKGWKGDIARAKSGRLKEADYLNQNAGEAFDAQEAAAQESARVAMDVAADKAGDPNAARAAVDEAGGALGFEPITTTGAAQRAIAQASVVAKEQEEAAKAQLKAEGARAQYTEALNRVKATVVNPNRLVANQPLAFGLQNAVAAIAAISGKPGMTNFANMLNDGMLKAMGRDVDAQMQMLDKNKAVAAGFKQVYDMVVDENDTQAQARNKMYGAYLASMEGYIESQMGQHDSEVINAQLAQSVAGIKSKRAEVENKNYADALDLGLKDAQLITSKYATDVNAATQRAQMAESRAARIQAAKDKALERADKQRAALAEGAIISPFASDQGRVAGIAKDEFKGDLAKTTAAVEKTLGISNDLRELAIQIEERGNAGDTIGAAALASEFGRRFDVAKNELAFALAQARQPGDPKISDGDRKAAEASISANPRDWILGAGAGGAVDQVERTARQAWDAASRQMMKSSDLYNETEQAYVGPRVVQHEYTDTGKAIFGAEGAAGVVEPNRYGYNPGKVGKVERDVEGAKWDKLMVPEVDTPTEKLAKEVFDVTNNGTSTIPVEKAPDWYKQYLSTDEGKYLGRFADDAVVNGKAKVPDFAQPMYNLAYKAQGGDTEAKAQLEKATKLEGDKFYEQRDMAQWMINNLGVVDFGRSGTDYLTRGIGGGNQSPISDAADDFAVEEDVKSRGKRENVGRNF